MRVKILEGMALKNHCYHFFRKWKASMPDMAREREREESCSLQIAPMHLEKPLSWHYRIKTSGTILASPASEFVQQFYDHYHSRQIDREKYRQLLAQCNIKSTDLPVQAKTLGKFLLAIDKTLIKASSSNSGSIPSSSKIKNQIFRRHIPCQIVFGHWTAAVTFNSRSNLQPCLPCRFNFSFHWRGRV